MPHSPLASAGATRAVLEEFGLTAKYALGQNFLVNDDVVGRILDLAQLSAADVVLEVGPGIGTLTRALLPHVAAVAAIEADRDMRAPLLADCADYSERLALVMGDALRVTPDQVRPPWPSCAPASCPIRAAAPPRAWWPTFPTRWRRPLCSSSSSIRLDVSAQRHGPHGAKRGGRPHLRRARQQDLRRVHAQDAPARAGDRALPGAAELLLPGAGAWTLPSSGWTAPPPPSGSMPTGPPVPAPRSSTPPSRSGARPSATPWPPPVAGARRQARRGVRLLRHRGHPPRRDAGAARVRGACPGAVPRGVRGTRGSGRPRTPPPSCRGSDPS